MGERPTMAKEANHSEQQTKRVMAKTPQRVPVSIPPTDTLFQNVKLGRLGNIETLCTPSFCFPVVFLENWGKCAARE